MDAPTPLSNKDFRTFVRPADRVTFAHPAPKLSADELAAKLRQKNKSSKYISFVILFMLMQSF